MHISKCVCVKFNGIDLLTPEFKSIVIFILRLIGPNKFILMLSICYIAPACIINVSYHQNAELLNLTHMLRGIQTCQYVGIKFRASCLCVIVLCIVVLLLLLLCDVAAAAEAVVREIGSDAMSCSFTSSPWWIKVDGDLKWHTRAAPHTREHTQHTWGFFFNGKPLDSVD